MDITFEGVTVKTREGRELLSSVSGHMRPGTLTSLMGASGSGKTTLLSTLSRRFEASLLYTGNVRYDGRKFMKKDRRAIAFVQQDDLGIVPGYLTVEEFLTYSARLRLNMDDAQRLERVEKVINRLRLQKCRKTVIGGVEARGVSGGERKRTSIANELLTEPSVVFTDEPTSGLDSTLSNVVIDILKDLATDGLTVVTTIHSPSSSIFDKFDTLIVLEEGKVFYRGKARELVSYIYDVTGKQVPPMFNPSDFLMDLLVLDKDLLKTDRVRKAISDLTKLETTASSASSSALMDADPQGPGNHVWSTKGNQNLPKTVSQRMKTALSAKNLMRSVSVIFRPGDDPNEVLNDKDLGNKFARPFPVQVALLTSRLWKRYKGAIFSRNQIISTLGLTLISGLLFFQLGYSEQEIFPRVALCLWLTGVDMYLGVFSTAFALQDDIPLVKKEVYDGTYSLAAHVIAKQLVLYPNNALWSLVFCIVVLAATRLVSNVTRAVLAILTVQASVFLFQGVGFLISAGVPTNGLLVLCVLIVTYFYAFNGFFAPYSLMPAWYQWLRWPGLLTYCFQLVMIITFGVDVTYSCNQAPTLSSYASCQNGTTISGQDILTYWNVDLASWTNISVILVSGICIRVATYYVYLLRMQPPKGIQESDAETGIRAWFRLRLCSCFRRHKKPTGPTHEEDDQDEQKDAEPELKSDDQKIQVV